jgi:phosphodiesterase/alkaline phosphatase D-like protein
VFDAILAAQPDLFVITGDWFYEDIAVNDRSAFRSAYDTTLTAPAQAALYRAVPVAYLWDDHDYGPNDANRTSASRPAAMATYRERVPHYPLGIEGADTPIAQAFTIGRVRFLVTDERSARDPQSEPDGPGKTMLGAEQKAWLETELRAASGQYPLIVWVTSVPWITPEEPGADHWGGYATERRELADFIESEGIAGLVMIAGDAHMVAIDDGTNNTFASSGARGFPVVHAAALDRPGSFKGGPYSHGAHPGPGQYGTMTVEDRGVAGLAVELRGVDWEGTEYVRYTFTAPTP